MLRLESPAQNEHGDPLLSIDTQEDIKDMIDLQRFTIQSSNAAVAAAASCPTPATLQSIHFEEVKLPMDNNAGRQGVHPRHVDENEIILEFHGERRQE